jgi:hypothetical protein
MITTVSNEGYTNMKKVICEVLKKHEKDGIFKDCLKTKALIKTPVAHLWMAFTQPELMQAIELFEMSNLILETENLLPVN